jgi:hypothetical protein
MEGDADQRSEREVGLRAVSYLAHIILDPHPSRWYVGTSVFAIRSQLVATRLRQLGTDVIKLSHHQTASHHTAGCTAYSLLEPDMPDVIPRFDLSNDRAPMGIHDDGRVRRI